MRDNRAETERPARRPGRTAAEAKRILRLAWPIMLTSLNWTLMHLIDVVVVGQFGTGELAALAASRTLTFISIVMAFSGLSGVLVYAARADGGGRLSETGDIFRSGLAVAAILAAATVALLLALAEPLLRLVGVAGDLLAPGAAVVEAMALAFPAQFVLAACSYFLEGISRPRRVMAVNLAILPLNALLAWAWVGGHLGLPALGAVGAAYATATASSAGAVMILLLCAGVCRGRKRAVYATGRPRRCGARWRACRAWPGSAWCRRSPPGSSSPDSPG